MMGTRIEGCIFNASNYSAEQSEAIIAVAKAMQEHSISLGLLARALKAPDSINIGSMVTVPNEPAEDGVE